MTNKRLKKGLLITGILFLMNSMMIAQESKPVLLLWDSSNFKDQLAEEIIAIAEDSGVELELEDSASSIQKLSLMDYSGIIVLNRGTIGKMNRKVTKVLEERDTLPPMVIVTTFAHPSGKKNQLEPYPMVDGITSASLKEDDEIQALAEEVFAFLNL